MQNENKKLAKIIKQIQKGNKRAFDDFYKLTNQKAYFIALKITQNEHDAEDVLQESYMKAFEKINEADTSQSINSWFLKIVSNKSKDLLKSRNRFVFEGDEEGIFEEIPEERVEFSPEENLDQEELRCEVMAAIDELTDEKRACIMLKYFGDMSVKEIAESIELPESTVKNRLHTARKDLKSRFEKSGGILYGAALGSVLIWALNKTSLTASAAFLASAASAEIIAGATAASTATATATATTTAAAATTAAASTTAASTAASAGTGIAAKLVVASVAQKIAVGVAATAVIGGSTAGVVTVVKNAAPEKTTTAITEEVTTAPEHSTRYVFNEATTLITEVQTVSQAEKETHRETATTALRRTTTSEHTTAPTVSAKTTEKKETTTRKRTVISTTSTTTPPETTTNVTSTTVRETTTEETTTRKETTTQKPTTTSPPTSTQPTTTQPTTTEATTAAPAMLVIEVTDFDNSVVATITETVEAGTELTRDYLVALVSANGYEAMAGIYGDAIGSVAQSGESYSFTAEL